MTGCNYSEVFDDIYENYGFGGKEKVKGETRSGPGSTIAATKHIQSFILHAVEKYNIKSVVDIPCGDFNWMSQIVDSFESYQGFDISSKCIEDNINNYPDYDFTVGDLIAGDIPDCDLLIVRDVIGHMPLEYGTKAVQNIMNSNWKVLISTNWLYVDKYYDIIQSSTNNHVNTGINKFGRCYKVNLLNDPFNLPVPNEFIYDIKELGKTQSLWVKDNPNKTNTVEQFHP